jgi:acyl-[acyl-carrier-protein]-phospholipid O-acyltransferase/long-chain-fatty-acid--[acyl-carrier-protein] ligase
LGAGYFYLIGSFTQMNIIPFAMQSLGLSDIQGGYLFFLTALGIGTGATIAGKISGRIVELGLVPFGAMGIAICAFLLNSFSDNLYVVIASVTCLGIFGGIFEIPLESYVMVSSPRETRGQIQAATNFVSFLGVLAAAGLVYLNAEIFSFQADKGFAIIGFLTIGIMIAFAFQFIDYVTRFIAMILSSLHFRTLYVGRENIPECPALYVCTHTAWNDTLLLLGSQRRRMRFFIEQEQKHSPWMKRLYKLLRVVFIPDIEPLTKNPQCLEAIQKTLKKGISVCIFIESWDIYTEVEKLHQSEPFNHIMTSASYPIIPVKIEKGTKHPASHIFKRLVQKYRVPASLAFGNVVYEGNNSLLHSRHEHELYFDNG